MKDEAKRRAEFLEGIDPDIGCCLECDKKLHEDCGDCQPVTKPTNPKHGLGIRKVPIHTVPIAVMSEVGLAMMEGGCKYGTHNYREMGVRASTYVDAVWRHLYMQWWEGEDIDKDSGLNHVSKAISSLVVLRDCMLMGNWVDDRPLKHLINHTEHLNHKASVIVDKYPNPMPGYFAKSSKGAE